jgi:hypothetical protein
MHFNCTDVTRTQQQHIDEIKVQQLALNTICASVSTLCDLKSSCPDTTCDVFQCGVTSDPEFDIQLNVTFI